MKHLRSLWLLSLQYPVDHPSSLASPQKTKEIHQIHQMSCNYRDVATTIIEVEYHFDSLLITLEPDATPSILTIPLLIHKFRYM